MASQPNKHELSEALSHESACVIDKINRGRRFSFVLAVGT